jgi:phage-related protein (TIGR01555 family)
MDDLGQLLSLGGEQIQERLYRTLQAQNWLMSNMGLQILDAKDGMETHQYTFAGLDKVYENFMMDIAGASEYPITKLFGRSPAGLNATGDSDMQNYYDSVEQKQETHLRPVIEKLLPVICLSVLGDTIDDIEIKFNPVRRPTEAEQKNLGKNVADSVVAVFNAGLISQKIAMKELRQSSDQTGMWSNITDEDIEKADAELQPPGEKMGGMESILGGLFGEEGEEGSITSGN